MHGIKIALWPGRLTGRYPVDGLERAETVLCIDDDPKVLTIRRLVLERTGYSVLTASSARAGLELFVSCVPDAVLLDYSMPEMNGGEVAAVMKAISPDIPVLLLSALPSLPENARSVDAFVTKGQSPKIWLDVLAALLASRSGTRLDSGASALQAAA
jgi:CheY-like chemotaxis protein